jgi:[ribosomal protein S5]-alanine N-acetyltransferase
MADADRPFEFSDLETPRLVLRSITVEDAGFLFRLFSDPQVYQYLTDYEPMTTRNEAAALTQFYVRAPDGDRNRWILVERVSGEPIGTCGYHKWHRHAQRAEIGYDLAPRWWGRGLMAEAMGAAIGFGFERMGLHRIESLVHTENARSHALMRRLGFVREGLLREADYCCGQFHSYYAYSLLRGEWSGVLV